MLVPFPAIPDVADGMILSAGQMNAYKSGVEWLLGEAHAPIALWQFGSGGPWNGSTSQTTDQPVWWGHMYHGGDTLHFIYGASAYNGACVFKLIYIGDDGNPHDATPTYDGAYTSWQEVTITGIDHLPYMTKGKVYEWRVQCHVKDAGTNASAGVTLFHLSEHKTLTNWVTPPSFVTGPSSAAQLNTLKQDILALYSYLSPTNPLMVNDPRAGTGSWIPWGTYIFRYRPHGLSVAARASCATGHHWQARVMVSTDRSHWAQVWTSNMVTAISNDPAVVWGDAIDFTTGDAAAALAEQGIVLHLGDYLFVQLQLNSPDSGGVRMWQQVITRWSSQVPASGWAGAHLFSQGETTVTPSNLTKYTNDVKAFYTGGVEELWSENMGFCAFRDPSTWGVMPQSYSGRHRKRWLCYLASATSPATLHCGTGFTKTTSLPSPTSGDWAWQCYDLEQVSTLFPGGAYYVENVDGAFECDIPLVTS